MTHDRGLTMAQMLAQASHMRQDRYALPRGKFDEAHNLFLAEQALREYARLHERVFIKGESPWIIV